MRNGKKNLHQNSIISYEKRGLSGLFPENSGIMKSLEHTFARLAAHNYLNLIQSLNRAAVGQVTLNRLTAAGLFIKKIKHLAW